MATTYNEYTQGENGNFFTAFQITFPFLSPADLKVTVNGVPTAASVTNSVAVIDPVPEVNDVIRITRDTDIESARSVFVDPSALLASDLNRNVDQAIYKLQELETTIETLTTSAPGGAGMPTATANNLFLVSGSNGSGGWSWFQKTTGEVTSLLGVGANAVPTPVPGWRFMLTHQTNATYILSTVAEVKALLGVNATIPAISGLANHFMTSNVGGTGYELSNASTARSKLGLGSAATLNTGTGVGNVPVLVSGTGSAALPAVSGENLTGVNKTLDYAMFERKAQITLPVSSGANVISSWTNITSSGAALMTAAVSPATSGWASVDSVGQNRLKLNPGTYYIKAESVIWNANAAAILRFFTWTDAGATISPTGLEGLPVTVHDDLSTAGNIMLGKAQVATIECVFRVTANTAYVAVDASRIGNQNSGTALYAGSTYHPSVRIHVWKLA